MRYPGPRPVDRPRELEQGPIMTLELEQCLVDASLDSVIHVLLPLESDMCRNLTLAQQDTVSMKAR